MADAPESPRSEPPFPADSPDPKPEPLLFGRYRVERELGRGGMGRVLLAFDTKLRVHVAVKLVPEQLMADAEAAEDLRCEVLRGMALTHPAIVRTHTFEQDDSGAAIVMEYIDGLTFSDWKKQQPGQCFDAEQLLPWLGPLCEALDYAHHEARIVHRDLKPRNIMVAQDGRLKVADFGIAASLSDSVSRVTGAGPSSGTPAYMSPQQARGKKPSPLDDVYALGATIYELLASKPPFFRGNADTILHQLALETPPTTRERREELGIIGKAPIPEVWEQAIAACLAKEPAARPQSCGEVLARLCKPEPVAAIVPLAPAPLAPPVEKTLAAVTARRPIVRVATPRELAVRSRPRRGKWIALAAVFTAAAGAWWWFSGKEPAAHARPPIAAATPIASTPSPASTPAPAAAPPKPAIVQATPAPTAAKATPLPATPKPQSEIDKWLAQVDAIYQPKWQKEVIAPYECGLDELKKSTLAALDAQLATATRAAKLNDAVAVRNERQRIESDQGAPADDSDTPPAALKTLRATWRTQSARLETDRRQHAQTVFAQYDKVLATNQAALTQRQRLDEALQLQQRRDALKKEWMGPASASTKIGNPATATQDKPLVNTLGMKFVPVPGTEILMCIHETRRKDYAGYSDAVPGVDETWKAPLVEGKPLTQGDDHPVVQVSWEDATAFCEWLSKKEGRTYRLPTEHEWNLAVVIGLDDPETISPADLEKKLRNQFPWSTGNEAGGARYGNYDRGEDGFDGTAPVMSFLPNHLGIYDLGGNAWEWCNDWFRPDQKEHVMRGCGYRNNSTFRASSTRDRGEPGFRVAPLNDGTRRVPGFRCVVTVSAPPTPSAPPVPVGSTSTPVPTASPATATVAPATPRPSSAASNRADTALANATKDAPFVNSLGMKFVPVPGTKVLFCIHETRRHDYAAYATVAPGVDGSWKSVTHDGIPVGDKDDHPVVAVSWSDAQAFCTWLSKKELKTYRLPTDREWSFAVGIGREERRIKDTTPEKLNGTPATEFPWGGNFPPKTKDQAGNYPDVTFKEYFAAQEFIEGYTDGFATTAPVMSFKPNNLGIFDLGGNVQEWCEDSYGAVQIYRVARGATWESGYHGASRRNLLSSHRGSIPSDRRGSATGFRCVVELPGP